MTDLQKLQEHIIDMFDKEINFDESQEALLDDLKLKSTFLPDITAHRSFNRKSTAIRFHGQSKSVMIESFTLVGKTSSIIIIVLNDFMSLKPLSKLFNTADESERFFIALKSKLEFFRN